MDYKSFVSNFNRVACVISVDHKQEDDNNRYFVVDANDAYKKQEKASEITEDDLKKLLDDAQKTTDKFIAKVDEEFRKKEKEILAK